MKEFIRTKVSVVLGILVLITVFTLVRNDRSDIVLYDISPSLDNVASPIAAPSLVFNSGDFLKLEVVQDQEDRERGLSGREVLPHDEGLLFVFEEAGEYGIWMMDMHFPIDIVWLDERFTVVGLQESAAPESYPEVYYPKAPSLYVLETNAGFARDRGIKLGEILEITL